MAQSILIVSPPGDLHAAAAEYALKKKGARVIRWFPADMPTRQVGTVRLSPAMSKSASITIRGPKLPRNGFSEAPSTVWLRRNARACLPSKMHSGDMEVAESQWRIFLSGVVSTIGDGKTFWVNHFGASQLSGNKLYQLSVARQVGWKVPDTIVSNDPDEISSFVTEHRSAVHKMLAPSSWRISKDKIAIPYTATVSRRDVSRKTPLRLAPGIYQEKVPKQYELRITCFGKFQVVTRIDSQMHEQSRLDWRLGQRFIDFADGAIPSKIRSLCWRYLQALNLAFGAIDVIVTPDGEYYFLEINPQGQFLWIEARTKVPILDMFAEYLLGGTPNFHWSPDHQVASLDMFVRNCWTKVDRLERATHVTYQRVLEVGDAQ